MKAIRSLAAVTLLLLVSGLAQAGGIYTLTVTIADANKTDERKYTVPGFTASAVTVPVWAYGKPLVLECYLNEGKTGAVEDIRVSLVDPAIIMESRVLDVFSARYPFQPGQRITALESADCTLTVQIDEKKE